MVSGKTVLPNLWYTFQYKKSYFGQLITSQTFNLIIGNLHDGGILLCTFLNKYTSIHFTFLFFFNH